MYVCERERERECCGIKFEEESAREKKNKECVKREWKREREKKKSKHERERESERE